MNIGQVCTRNVVIVNESDPLSIAAREMCERHVGTVVVVDDSIRSRKPIGIITDRDMIRAQLHCARDLFCLSVGYVMSRDPLVLSEDTAITDAIERMRVRGVRRAPVVDAEGALVGIVSVDDLFAVVAAELIGLARLVEKQPEREAA